MSAIDEIEGVISDIEAGQANAVCVNTLRRVAKEIKEIERLRAALDNVRAKAELASAAAESPHIQEAFSIIAALASPETVPAMPTVLGMDERTLQDRVDDWLLACFGVDIARDREERNRRFLEEALELVQACGCTNSEAHQLVDYVYGRPAGEKTQEVGGAVLTLAALCLAQGIDMQAAGETELRRVWTKIDKIRAKQAAKPKHSPLPQLP